MFVSVFFILVLFLSIEFPGGGVKKRVNTLVYVHYDSYGQDAAGLLGKSFNFMIVCPWNNVSPERSSPQKDRPPEKDLPKIFCISFA